MGKEEIPDQQRPDGKVKLDVTFDLSALGVPDYLIPVAMRPDVLPKIKEALKVYIIERDDPELAIQEIIEEAVSNDLNGLDVDNEGAFVWS